MKAVLALEASCWLLAEAMPKHTRLYTARTCACTHTHKNTHTCTHTGTHTYMHTNTHTCAREYTQTHMCPHAHTHKCAHSQHLVYAFVAQLVSLKTSSSEMKDKTKSTELIQPVLTLPCFQDTWIGKGL